MKHNENNAYHRRICFYVVSTMLIKTYVRLLVNGFPTLIFLHLYLGGNGGQPNLQGIESQSR